MKIIDCHTHLQTTKLIEEYFKNRIGYAISIKMLSHLNGNGNKFYKELKNKNNIFICECIDLLKPIKPQLLKIKKHMKKFKIIGIKIYLGYQPFTPDNEKLTPVYEFVKENGLSVVFHCGEYAKNLAISDIDASCVPIGMVAKKYPMISFIASHFDTPNYDDCAKLITENKNIFTDVSGEYENYNHLPSDVLINEYIQKILPIIKKYGKDKLSKKVMFGTDYFGIGTDFEAVEEYIETLEILFGKNNRQNFLWNNCLKAYPKIETYLTSSNTNEL